MTLPEQAALIEHHIGRWVEPDADSRFRGNPIWLCREDIEDLRTIAKTLRILGMHGADEYVRAKVARERKERGRR